MEDLMYLLPVESYHAILKRRGDVSYGLVGACKVVHEANEGYFNRAARTELEFRTKKTSETTAYPFLAGFPHLIQLLVDEIHAFQHRVEEGKPMPDQKVHAAVQAPIPSELCK